MDYSQLSDFEINVAVFEAIHNGSHRSLHANSATGRCTAQ